MNKYFFILYFFLLSFFCYAQENSSLYNYSIEPDSSLPDCSSNKQGKKITSGYEIGTMTGITSGKGSLVYMYARPHIDYNFTKRFTLHAGLLFINGAANRYPLYSAYENSFNTINGSFSGTFLYVQGSYQCNSKLTVSGSVYKQMSIVQPNGKEKSRQEYSPQSMSLGLNYKFKENTHIGIEVQVSNGYSPFMPSFRANPLGNGLLSY